MSTTTVRMNSIIHSIWVKFIKFLKKEIPEIENYEKQHDHNFQHFTDDYDHNYPEITNGDHHYSHPQITNGDHHYTHPRVNNGESPRSYSDDESERSDSDVESDDEPQHDNSDNKSEQSASDKAPNDDLMDDDDDHTDDDTNEPEEYSDWQNDAHAYDSYYNAAYNKQSNETSPEHIVKDIAYEILRIYNKHALEEHDGVYMNDTEILDWEVKLENDKISKHKFNAFFIAIHYLKGLLVQPCWWDLLQIKHLVSVSQAPQEILDYQYYLYDRPISSDTTLNDIADKLDKMENQNWKRYDAITTDKINVYKALPTNERQNYLSREQKIAFEKRLKEAEVDISKIMDYFTVIRYSEGARLYHTFMLDWYEIKKQTAVYCTLYGNNEAIINELMKYEGLVCGPNEYS